MLPPSPATRSRQRCLLSHVTPLPPSPALSPYRALAAHNTISVAARFVFATRDLFVVHPQSDPLSWGLLFGVSRCSLTPPHHHTSPSPTVFKATAISPHSFNKYRWCRHHRIPRSLVNFFMLSWSCSGLLLPSLLCVFSERSLLSVLLCFGRMLPDIGQRPCCLFGGLVRRPSSSTTHFISPYMILTLPILSKTQPSLTLFNHSPSQSGPMPAHPIAQPFRPGRVRPITRPTFAINVATRDTGKGDICFFK